MWSVRDLRACGVDRSACVTDSATLPPNHLVKTVKPHKLDCTTLPSDDFATCVRLATVYLSVFSSSVARGISAASMSSSMEIFITGLSSANTEGLVHQEGDIVSSSLRACARVRGLPAVTKAYRYGELRRNYVSSI